MGTNDSEGVALILRCLERYNQIHMAQSRCRIVAVLLLFASVAATPLNAGNHIDTPKEALGFNPGDDYFVAGYSQLEAYWKKLASQSDRIKLVDIGPTT